MKIYSSIAGVTAEERFIMNIDWEKYYEREHMIYPLSLTMNRREESLWKFVRELTPSGTITSMLDVGCGAGHITNKFAEHGIAHVTGIDISPHRVKFAQKAYPQHTYRVGSVLDLPFTDKNFDLVAAIEVLEHMDDLHKSIEELKRVSKRWILLTVPFEQDIPVVLCPHCLHQFNYDGHLQSFTQSGFVTLITGHGLRVQKVECFSGWMPSWKKMLTNFRLPDYAISLLQKMLIIAKLTQMPRPVWMGVLALKE